MGWTGCTSWKTVADVRKAILVEYYGSGTAAVRTATAKGMMWVLALPPGGVARIDLFLIEKNCGQYAFKDLCEAMGPYDVEGCPLDFLASAPETCPEWRARVRAFHAAKDVLWSPGDVTLIHEDRYTVVGPSAKAGKWHVRNGSGKVYTAKATDMVPVASA